MAVRYPHAVGLYWAFRYRGPAGTVGPCKALDPVYKAGLREGLEGAAEYTGWGRGGERERGGQAGTKCKGGRGPRKGHPRALGDCSCLRSGRRRGQHSRRVTCVSRRLVVLR